jgi:hypothetical protein
MSQKGHSYAHRNRQWATSVGLFVSIHGSYEDHVAILLNNGEDLDHPVFYDQWPDETLVKN